MALKSQQTSKKTRKRKKRPWEEFYYIYNGRRQAVPIPYAIQGQLKKLYQDEELTDQVGSDAFLKDYNAIWDSHFQKLRARGSELNEEEEAWEGIPQKRIGSH